MPRDNDLSGAAAVGQKPPTAGLRPVTAPRVAVQEDMFRSLADHSLEFIGMCDLEFRPFYVNPAGLKLVGLGSLEEACAVKVQDFFFPEDQRYITEEFFPKVLREGRGEVEIRLRHFKTGAALWMIYNVFEVRDAQGRVSGYATVSRDMTERKLGEERLKSDLAALTRMHELSRKVLGFEGLELLLQEVMEAAVAVAGAERGTLQLLEGGSLKIVAHHGHAAPFLKFLESAETRASVCGEATKRGERVVVPDVEASPLLAGTESLEVLRA